MRTRQEWKRKQQLLESIRHSIEEQNAKLFGPPQIDSSEVQLVEGPRPPPLPILVTERMLKPSPLPSGYGTDKHFKKKG